MYSPCYLVLFVFVLGSSIPVYDAAKVKPIPCVKQAALCERLEAKVIALYNQIIYPGPLFVLNQSVSLDNIFAPFAQGLVDPIGVFDNRQALAEYFFVFGAIPGTGITQAEIQLLSCNASTRIVSTRVRFLFNYFLPGGIILPYKNVSQSGSFVFGSNETITGTLLQNHLIGYLFDPLVANTTQTALQICFAAMNYCNSTNDPSGYYSSFAECVSYMTTYPTVTMDQMSGNTLQCRFIHHFFVPFDSFAHCPHIGKNGGGPCTTPYYPDYDAIVASILQ